MEGLCLKNPPHRDFEAMGLPEDTTEEALRQHLEILGVRIRSVDVREKNENDKLGTTLASVGTFALHENGMLEPSNWLTNISVQEWTAIPNNETLRKTSQIKETTLYHTFDDN